MGNGSVKGGVLTICLLALTPLCVAAAGDGTVGVWTFDEGSGVLEDHSGNGLDGTVHGDPVRSVQGVNSSTAYRFDGEDDWVEIPDDPLLDTGQQLTVSVWFRPDQYTAGVERLFQRDDSATYGVYVADGRVYFAVDTSTNGGSWEGVSHDLGPSGSWHHVVATYDGETMRLYINGSAVGTEGQSGDHDLGDTPAGIAAHPEEKQFFAGDIDDIRVYDRVLNGSEVRWQYEHPPGWDSQATSQNGTDDTSDGTTDNETTSDNTTDGTNTNETSDGTSDDGSLFTGGNGTAEDTGDGAANSSDMADGTKTNDGSAGGTAGNETTGDNDTTGETVTDEGGDVSMTVWPSRFDVAITANETRTLSLSIDNGGTERLSLDISVGGLSSVRMGRSSVTVEPDDTVTVPVIVGPSEDATDAAGTIQVVGNGISHAVPVHITVRPAATDGGVTAPVLPNRSRMSFNLTATRPASLMATVGIEGAARGHAVLEQTVRRSEGSVVYSDEQDISVGPYRELELRADGRFSAGEYTWTVAVSSPDMLLLRTRSFHVMDEERDGAGVMNALIVSILVIIAVAGLYVRYRGTEDDMFERFLPGS